MRYPGGKGKTFQHIINLMPPHRVYIETHLGGGSVLHHKLPAERSIAIDADSRVIEAWRAVGRKDVELVYGRAEDFLLQYDFRGDELLYVDPPYHPETRRRGCVYTFDYSVDDHEFLLDLLTNIPSKVILSGYAHTQYDSKLLEWRKKTFRAKTHIDSREETLWFNFEPPKVLHDYRYLGDNFRDRQTTKRRIQRLQEKVRHMDPVERASFAKWLYESYPTTSKSTPP